jgi:hypothetical protein
MRRRLTSVRALVAVLAAGVTTALVLSIALAAPSPHAPRTITTHTGFSCAGARSAPNVVTTPVEPRLLQNLGVLRRPATPQDTPSKVAQRRLQFGRGAHVAASRLIRSGVEAPLTTLACRIVAREPPGLPGLDEFIEHAQELALRMPALTRVDLVLATDGQEAGDVAARIRGAPRSTRGTAARGAATIQTTMRVELLYFDGCPSHEAFLPRLRQLLERAGVDVPVEQRRVESDAAAQAERFLGSPTLRVDGVDIDPSAAERDD